MIAGIVLAGGTSSRLGRPKQLLPFRGRPLLERTLERIRQAPLDELIVVLGGSAEAIQKQVAFDEARVVINLDYAQGLSTSLRCGLAASEGHVEAVVILLGDQPLVDPRAITALIAAYRQGSGPIVVPAYRGGRGNPVLFARGVFPLLHNLSGDEGARPLLRSRPDLVVPVPLDMDAPPADIDTWDDYRAVLVAAGEPDPGPRTDEP